MHYDFVICGGGAAGLSFVHHLLKSELKNSSVLVLDKDAKNKNDRTWSFWSVDRPDYVSANFAWENLGFASDGMVKIESIAPFKYYTIHGLDFYEEILREISDAPNVTFLQEEIVSIEEKEESVEVRTATGAYQGDRVIDSISLPKIGEGADYWLSQNFLGWTIETKSEKFDVGKPILMDFRTEWQDPCSFFYFLPYSPTKALIEFTQFSTSRAFDPNAYEMEIQRYISDILGVSEFTVLERKMEKFR